MTISHHWYRSCWWLHNISHKCVMDIYQACLSLAQGLENQYLKYKLLLELQHPERKDTDIQKVCLKSNRTSVTNNLFQFQTTNHMIFSSFPLESNALSDPSLPCINLLMEGFFWDASQLCYYGILNGLHAFKMSSLDNALKFGEKKKVTWSQNQVNRKIFSVQECSSWSGNTEWSGCCE